MTMSLPRTPATAKSNMERRLNNSYSRRSRKERTSMDGARVAFEAMFRPCRAAVYTHKTRFMEDGFDLDLVYVTKRIIIHGVSSSNSDPFYEDPRTEVRRLLDKYHLDRYKVYNFASERGQVSPSGGEQKMDGRTESYPFTDDTCPPLESVVEFCENAKAWLDADVDNVVSLHCKGGKGRAGIMAACLMVRMGETAQAAVSKYDETQLSDTRGRTAANQRAWVFLYERLIREVWGLRDTIGTVSGQDPCLKAPPRLATSLREICLEMQTPPSRGNWRPVLYNPSCAVYQQTPGGKAMIHRAKMPPVCAGKKRGTPRSFSAALPRSVVVEGTFQVVVSAATGMFGLGKNVLDVWCNTTFLGDDGGQEVFNFTTNDLPPGTLAERLLASGVRVVITHSHPNVSISAASLGEKQAVASLDPSALRAETSARPSQTSVTIMSTSTEGNGGHRHDGNEGGGEEDVSTPETMQELSGSEDTAEEDKEKDKDEGVGLHGKLGEHATSLISERASVRQGGESPKRKRHSLRITVDDEAGWLAASARRSNRKLTRSTSAVEGFKNRLIDTHPSPLRSCPRSVAFRSERMVMSATQGNERILRRWASTSWQERIPRSLPVTPVSPGRRVVAVVRPMVPTATPDAIARVFERLGKQPYAATPSPPMEAKGFRSFSSGRERVIEAARTTGNDAYANVGVGASWRGDGGDNCGDNGDECISLEMEGREPKARARAQTEGAAGQLGRVDGVKSRRRELVINKTIFPEAEEITKAGVSEDGFELDDLESEDLTPGLTPSGSGLRRPFPTRRVLLETASEKSLEDIISCSHHTARSVPESGEDHVGQNTEIMNVEPMPSSECDDEKAANAARALAGWVDSKLQRPLCGLEATPTDGSSRLIAVVGGIASGSTKYIETEDLSSIPPLKHRGWPPAKPVVAGEMEVHDALMLDDDEEPPVRAIRKWGSAETSWGEEAKLALARKRLQWEKSRRGSYQGSESLRMHAAMIAKREAEILAIETDVKEAVRILEERIARRESAEVALDNWRRQLPPQAYQDVMSCLNGLGGLAATSATSA